MYDNSPNFNFTGSSIPGLPTTLNYINPAYYHQIADFVRDRGARLASVNGLVLYDTLRMDPATTLSTSGFRFFQNGVNTQQGLYNAGTAYTKNTIDIHKWIQNGKLDDGYEALIWSIQIRIQLPGASDETVQTSGNALNLTNSAGAIFNEAAAAGQGDAIKTGNVLRAMQEGLFFEFKINDTSFESGPGWRFPSVYHAGNQIAISGVVASAISDAAMGNSMGWAYQMPVMRHIPSNTRFSVDMQVQNAMAFALTDGIPQFRIVCILEGIGISPITG